MIDRSVGSFIFYFGRSRLTTDYRRYPLFRYFVIFLDDGWNFLAPDSSFHACMSRLHLAIPHCTIQKLHLSEVSPRVTPA